ncbi:MAG: glycoside hydrolase family 16 protein [Clostridia bacterium]|nr:glycoside hydrolase family 16 protein [Clostridia bacterium]
MLEKIYDLFGWTFHQRHAFENLIKACGNLFGDGFSFKSITASIMVIVELFSAAVFKTPQPAVGDKLDLSGYTRVLYEEFEGDSLNTELWKCRGTGKERCGYNAPSQIRVEDGKLIITGEYREDGELGPGWYSAEVALKEWQEYGGYFEIKCICNRDYGFWSAFWMQSEHSYDHELSAGGVGGAEIDIFEAMSYDAMLKKNRNAVTQTIWCNGGDDDPDNLDKIGMGRYYGNDIYDTYNTYGLLWTEDEYVFYVNGIETARTSQAVSHAPEQLIMSLCLPGEINFSKDYKTEFIIDSVSIYR